MNWNQKALKRLCEMAQAERDNQKRGAYPYSWGVLRIAILKYALGPFFRREGASREGSIFRLPSRLFRRSPAMRWRRI